ncbi:hypothetical protein ACHHYP_02201 [Achlya hypogyna]|uniref:Uncharacterized protein n=1 Tax=Achlya hypogyna TaxID=1202772 RepID=A0A1V9Z7H4_ACHHY|nr:hypothetical protein ACHHYP_02201 [Achlya hypogyna]
MHCPVFASALKKHRPLLRRVFFAHATPAVDAPLDVPPTAVATLNIDQFLLLAKTHRLYPKVCGACYVRRHDGQVFTREELVAAFNDSASASPYLLLASAVTEVSIRSSKDRITFPGFVECLFRCAAGLFITDTEVASPAHRFQALVLLIAGDGSLLQKTTLAIESERSKAEQAASRARVDAILSSVAIKRLAKHKAENPQRPRPIRWKRGPLDDVYAASPARTPPSVLTQALEKAQLRLLRRSLAAKSVLKAYTSLELEADDL